MKTKLKL